MEICENLERSCAVRFLPLQQSPIYAETVCRLGARVRWVGREQEVLAIERGRMRMILRASVDGTGKDAVRSIRRMARWPGVTLVTTEEPIHGLGLIPLVTPLHHAIWELGPDIRRGMARNWRGHLGQAERFGHRITRGGNATLERLLAAEVPQRAVRRYRALLPEFARALPEGALRLWEWRQGGVMQAAMAFVRHGTSASYHLAWGSDLAKGARIHPLMLTRAAEDLYAEGVRWLDLGSVDSERAPGLMRFKLGTGARLHRLGATMLVLP